MAPKRLIRKVKRGKVRRVIRKLKAPPQEETLARAPADDRPSVNYSFELSERICERLANGESATAITRDAGMPSYSVMARWLREKPDFARRYRIAREAGYEYWADDLIDIADQTQVGEVRTTQEWGTQVRTADMLEHRRLRIDARKWLLCKRARHIYGERAAFEHSGPEGKPMEVTSRNELIEAIVKLVHPKADPSPRKKADAEERGR